MAAMIQYLPNKETYMDTQRLILFAVFSLSIFMLWDAWQREHNPLPPLSPISTTQKNIEVPTPSLGGKGITSNPTENAKLAQLEKGQRISVKTDVIDAEIDLNGGDLRKYVLLKHGDSKDKTKPLVFLADEKPHFYVAQSGLIGEGLPSHKALFSTAAKEYTLAKNADQLQIRLSWKGENAVQVDKIFTFERNSYLIKIAYEIKNNSPHSIIPEAYFQFLRDATPPEGDSRLLPTYTGPAVYTDEHKFQKHAFDKIGGDPAKDSIVDKSGWISMLQHYFIAAYLPAGNTQHEFYFKKVGENLYTTGVIVPVGEIAPNTAKDISMGLYAGPQDQETLKKLAPGLNLAIDYGWLTIVARPIFWLLSFLHKIFGNWGWSIIVLTILIKLAFYPLSAASYRSMAKMKALAPRLQRLKEQYGEDRQKLHQAMMDIYKTEKINPLGGCLPVVIQIPVFIALYWVLLYSVEMRHAPFALWIQDLTAQDPFYVLPVLMGLSMLVQARLNPTPPDPIQAKIMMIMPIAFSIMFFWFPAGLVLYWVVNNTLSIAQQWRINAVMKNAPKKAKR